MSRYRTRTVTKTIDVYVDIDMDDFDDADIEEEYRDRVERGLITPDDSNVEWLDVFEARRSKSVEEFFKYLDKIIMDKTGRIL